MLFFESLDDFSSNVVIEKLFRDMKKIICIRNIILAYIFVELFQQCSLSFQSWYGSTFS